MTLPGTTRLRQSLLALITLAILLVATGGAWLMVQAGQGRAGVGADLVKQIHDQGLSQWWTGQARVQWFLASQKGRTTGWQVQVRSSLDDTHQGLQVEIRATKPDQIEAKIVEKWRLNNQATAGHYESSYQDAQHQGKATIELANNNVQIAQFFPPRINSRAAATPPANYLPEGTLPLAIALVAQQKNDAQFSLVVDDHPNSGGVLSFVTIRLRYRGQEKTDLGMLEKVVMTGMGGEATYLLSGGGEIRSMGSEEDVTWTATTEKDVAALYPSAPNIMAQLSENLLPGQGKSFWQRLLGGNL